MIDNENQLPNATPESYLFEMYMFICDNSYSYTTPFTAIYDDIQSHTIQYAIICPRFKTHHIKFRTVG